MRISILSHNGVQPAHGASHDFDARGGGIGREDGNELVLPDPERHISRLQARVIFENGEFFLEDQGGNPSAVNDRPVGRGHRVALREGDRISIGSYILLVEFERATPVFAAAESPKTHAPDPLGLFGGASVEPAAPDPFGGTFNASTPKSPPASSSDDPFAVFMMPGSAPAAQSAPADPFSSPAPQASSATRGDPLGLGPGSREPSIDTLFGGLGKTGPDLFAGTPLGDSLPTPADASGGEVDPLALLGGATRSAPPADPQRDDVPALNQAFVPPKALASARQSGDMVFSWDTESSPPAGAKPAPPATDRSEPAAVPPQAVEASSDHDTATPAKTVILGARPSRTDTAIEPVVPSVAPALATPPTPAPTPTPALASSGDALLDALRRGLGVPLAPPEGLTPEFMEQLGVVLREATQGTLDLLTARALTKREVRAEVTMIVSKGNNPLKFSPDVGFALSQLLVPQGRGFMAADEAMRDAYDDLRAHQFGFMAGMRAALAGVLKRFEPDALEARVASRGVFDNLLPGSRKARLWDLFEQMYGEISREAEDDFHALFGREFLRAYEEQVERLQDERAAGR